MQAYDAIINSSPALIVAIPLLFAFATPLISKIGDRFRNIWAILGVLIPSVLMFILALDVIGSGGMETRYYVFGADSTNRFPLLGGHILRIAFAVDGMSVFMGLLISIVALSSVIYSMAYAKRYTGLDKYFTLLLLVLAANYGMVLTGDIFNLFVWFEISSISLSALTAFKVNRGVSFEGAAKYLMYSTVAGLLLLVAIGLLYGQYGHLNIKFLSEAIGGNATMMMVDKIALGLMVTVFAVKAGSVPLHMATPDAYGEAPAPVTAMFVTASQAGLYAIFRTGFTLYGSNLTVSGETLHILGYILVGLGILSMFVGVTMALVQKDIKRLMAYHAISQTGYMLLGVGVGLAVLDTVQFAEYGRTAMTGGIFHIFNHALYKGLLFLAAGAIIYRTGTKDLNKMGGLGRDMKLTALFFIIGALAIAGIPPMNGFASKILIYESVFKFNPLIGAICMLVSLLTLASFVKVFYSVFMGPRRSEFKGGEVPRSMIAGMTILAGVILAFSILPSLVVSSLVDPAVNALTHIDGKTSTSLTLFTGSGSWNTIVFIGAILVASMIGMVLFKMGRKGTVPQGEGKRPYLFGNPTEVEGRPVVIPASNVYWGFTTALSRYYRPTEKAHSAFFNDYMFWLVATTALIVSIFAFIGVLT
jgi:multicomponent Na+:H+ antiporter subunit D